MVRLEELRARANIATLDEAVDICGVKREELEREIRAGNIPTKWGKVDLEDVQAFVDTTTRDVEEEFCEVNKRQRNEMVRMWKDDKSPAYIAAAFHVKVKSVRRALNRAGVTLGELSKRRWDEQNDKVFEFLWCQTLSTEKVMSYFGLAKASAQGRANYLRRKGYYLPPLNRARSDERMKQFREQVDALGSNPPSGSMIRLARRMGMSVALAYQLKRRMKLLDERPRMSVAAKRVRG